MDEKFNDKVAQYFAAKLGWGRVEVREAKRLMGGISRETWRMSMEVHGPTGKTQRDVVLRLDPSASLLASNRDIEYAMFRAFAGVAGVPAPEALCNESDPSYLGTSFMATAALSGIADISAVMRPPFVDAGRRIALAHFEVLGAIARLDPREKQLDRVLKAPTVDSAAAEALAHWETVLRDRSLGPAPITQAAIRYLHRRLPAPPKRICVVHGDYRLGNCLYLPDGAISGVLDWEMAHLGDPLEDLAWAMHPDWRPSAAPAHFVAGHITEEEAIRAWEASSGQAVNREALNWWRLFTCVKAAAIFTTGGRNFVDHPDTDLIYALSAWGMIDNQEALMLRWMEKRA